jgi:hypothetical protein
MSQSAGVLSAPMSVSFRYSQGCPDTCARYKPCSLTRFVSAKLYKVNVRVSHGGQDVDAGLLGRNAVWT